MFCEVIAPLPFHPPSSKAKKNSPFVIVVSETTELFAQRSPLEIPGVGTSL